MNIVPVGNVTLKANDNNSRKAGVLKAGLSWFTLDMAVGTVADIFHSSKNATKLSKKKLGKQVGINALWAAASACLLASPIEKVCNCIKEKKDVSNNDIISTKELAIASIASAFFLYIATRQHPKLKGIFSIDIFDVF